MVALVHVEVETRKSAVALRPRMFEYYALLRRDLGLPVWPIGLYLRVGMDGVGWDAYEEYFWDHRILRFEYAYVGLPALDAEQYVNGEQLLGVALYMNPVIVSGWSPGFSRCGRPNRLKPGLQPDSLCGCMYEYLDAGDAAASSGIIPGGLETDRPFGRK